MQAIGNGTSSLVQALTAPTVTNAGSSKDGWKWNYDNRESAVLQLASTAAHAHTAIFPNLEFLELTELDFFGGNHGIPFDVFERGLQQRMEVSGAPLKFLRMIGCEILTEHENDLRKLVQDFDWEKTINDTALHVWDSDGHDDDNPDRDDYDDFDEL
jgi:hypothetical protein